MERIKNELRDKLNAMSKEELVDIIADLCSAYIFASATSGLISSNRVHKCINEVQTNLQDVDELNKQKINANTFKL